MNVRIHIDRLVLDGFSLAHGESAPLQAAVEAELSRLLREGGIHPGLASGGALANVQGGSLELKPSIKTAALGGAIAQAAYKGFGK